MPVQVSPSDSFDFRYSIMAFFCPKRGIISTTAVLMLFEDSSDGINLLIPARTAASINFFWSSNAVAPTSETTASWPLKAATRLSSEKSDFFTVTVEGKVASLVSRDNTVTLKSEEARNA